MNELDTLAAAWSAAKTAEGEAVEARRAIEDRLVALLAIPEGKEGTANASTEQGMVIKIVGRLNRKINTDRRSEERWCGGVVSETYDAPHAGGLWS